MHNKNVLLCGGGTGGHYYPLKTKKKDLEFVSEANYQKISIALRRKTQ